MNLLRSLCLFFLLFAQLEIFGQQTDCFEDPVQILQAISHTEEIIARFPEIIKWENGEKLYLDEAYIEKRSDSGLGALLHVDARQQHSLPLVLQDECGYSTSLSGIFWEKAFHQICNVCKFEWEGGLFSRP